MRYSSAIFISVLACCSWCPLSSAQQCEPWLNVKHWKGMYSLVGKGSGVFQGTWNATMDNQMSADLKLTTGPRSCASTLSWTGSEDNSSASITDVFVLKAKPCVVTTYTGNGPNILPAPTLTIDLTNQSYSFMDTYVLATVNGKADVCGKIVNSPTSDYYITPDLGSVWPKFDLPATVATGLTALTTVSLPYDAVPIDWALNVSIQPTCVVPTTETTAFEEWGTTLGYWKQTLTPSNIDFSGSKNVTEKEAAPGMDSCWFPGSAFNKFIHLTGGTWDVNADNVWEPDSVGWNPTPVAYYRREHRAPCGFTFFQQMTYKCADGSTFDYGPVNTLRGVIASKTVQSSRAGHTETEKWP